MFYSYKDGDSINRYKIELCICYKVGIRIGSKVVQVISLKTCSMGHKNEGSKRVHNHKKWVFNNIKNRVFIGIESIQ